MWWLCRDVEKSTRMIGRARRAAGKTGGEVIEADVEVRVSK